VYNAPEELRVAAIANTLGVPIISVYYAPYDLDHVRTVDLMIRDGKHEYYLADKKWRAGFLRELLEEQVWHEEKKHNCYSKPVVAGTSRWIDGEVDQPIDDEAELPKGKGIDLTVSDIIRHIPGVRHLDMDGCATCEKCGKPIAMIEASSDGYSRGASGQKGKRSLSR
jgi:hypothetical protein